jgi:hypothetical protein
VTQLASKTIAAINQLTVNHDTRTYTSAQSDNDKVFHTTGYAIGHLTDSSCIGIVGKTNRDAKLVREQLCQRHYTIATPLKVGCKLDSTIIVVAVRGTDTHSFNLVNATHLVDDDLQRVDSSVNIIVYIFVSLCLDGSGSLNISHGCQQYQTQSLYT